MLKYRGKREKGKGKKKKKKGKGNMASLMFEFECRLKMGNGRWKMEDGREVERNEVRLEGSRPIM